MESYIPEFQGSHEKESDVIVTVDGVSGAGKGTLAKHVADRLDIKYFSAGDFFRSIAEDRGMTVEELSKKADRETDIEVDRRTLEQGLKQSCVIDGRLPSWVMGDFSDLRIYMTADLEERAERIAEREGITVEEARKRTEERDRDNRKRYMDYYGIDTRELEIYDVIMDNSEMSIQEQNERIDKVLEKRFNL